MPVSRSPILNNHSVSPDHKANSILNALSRAEFERLRPKLHPVALKYGKTIYQPEQEIEDVHGK